MRSLRMLSILVLLGTVAAPTRLWAWGALGHELQAEAAAALMQSPLKALFTPNVSALKRMINVPDKGWKSGAGANDERPAHFFHWDFYERSEIGQRFPLVLQSAMESMKAAHLRDNGTALWRIDQIQELMKSALRSKNWPQTVQMAGVLGHYIGDLSQPLHITSDYDGQSIGRRGIHKHFETDLLRRQNRGALLTAVLKRASELSEGQFSFAYDSTILDMTFEDSKVAFEDLTALLRVFQEDEGTSEDARLLPLAIDGLARGALTLARAWDLAASQTNAESFPEITLSVSSPAWVAFRIRDGEPAPLQPSSALIWDH